jgi:hypothetical protein
MLYAPLKKEVWGTALPASWDKSQDMFKYLQSMTWGYQIVFESRMIYSAIEPAIKCLLIRWEDGRNVVKPTGDKNREVLLETSDPEQMEAALFMLINEAEQAVKTLNPKISMVP